MWDLDHTRISLDVEQFQKHTDQFRVLENTIQPPQVQDVLLNDLNTAQIVRLFVMTKIHDIF